MINEGNEYLITPSSGKGIIVNWSNTIMH